MEEPKKKHEPRENEKYYDLFLLFCKNKTLTEISETNNISLSKVKNISSTYEWSIRKGSYLEDINQKRLETEIESHTEEIKSFLESSKENNSKMLAIANIFLFKLLAHVQQLDFSKCTPQQTAIIFCKLSNALDFIGNQQAKDLGIFEMLHHFQVANKSLK